MTEELQRRLSAVMFTDVVGYTAIMQEDEEAARAVRLRHREALEAAVAGQGGELVQYLGDGSLSTFPSAVRAVSAGIEIQRALRDDVPLRIGVHQGEITFDEQGVYGDSVNVAARVMGLGTAGSVLVSEKVNDELKNQRDFSTALLGQFHLKNVKHPPSIYAVDSDGIAVPTRDDLLAVSDSTPLYKGVTQHWPKVALAAVAIAVAAGFVLPDLTAGVSFQSYVFAWAVTTAGIWFLFDKAEAAMSAKSRTQVVTWLGAFSFKAGIESIPAQFALLFDRVFGERHLTLKCLSRSAIASVVAVVSVHLMMVGLFETRGLAPVGEQLWALAVLVAVFNVIPDYISLLETRWALRFMRRSGRTLLVLVLDAAATSIVSASFFVMIGLLAPSFGIFEEVTGDSQELLLGALVGVLVAPYVAYIALQETMDVGPEVFYFSAFFTSAWLWLYAASVLLSRVLLRMNNGVGFLLRATDLERQPFRSMGFVSVIIVSVLFALGLPLVVL